jgi:NhaA family Na+:H+ antiporter
VLRPLADFLQTEAAGGVVLLVATIAALVWANTFSGAYTDFWHHTVRLGIADASIEEDLQHWVNDGLMAIFFFVVGLEIKRELVIGELRDPKTAALPAIAALGGMVLPALLFVAVTAGTDASKGWGIPMATDIAFAVGVLALLGPRIPSPLKLFLLTLAIVDDVGAIIVIAFFYSDDLEPRWMLGGVVAVLVILAMRRARISPPIAYLLPAVALWVCTFESGVHATLAGVVLGVLTPAVWPHSEASPIERLEHRLHPVASFAVVPVFALANAGVAIGIGDLGDALASSTAWGVVVGLIAGKIVGVSAATLLAARTGAGRLPPGVTPRQIVGVSALAGIGFTVSLFIAELSFGGGRGPLADAKIGVLLASVVGGGLGAAILRGRPGSNSNSRE